MEVGCGNGALLRRVLDRCPEAEITGVDIKDLGLSLHPKIHFLEGQLERIALPEGSFDVIYCSNLIEHVSDPLVFLARISALLATNGRVIMVTPNHLSVDRFIFGRYWGAIIIRAILCYLATAISGEL